MEIAQAAASYDYHAWTVYFDSIECPEKFEKDPDAYMHRLDDDRNDRCLGGSASLVLRFLLLPK